MTKQLVGSLGPVLDLGCGTGLARVELKPFCCHLEGIDLSHSMIKQIQKKNIYDQLIQGNIVDCLSTEELDFDYFLATDVFIYVGDLSDVFRLIKFRNKRSGTLAFSTEHNAREDIFLETSGRYSHSKKYIQNLCEKFSYKLSHFAKADRRKEKCAFLTGGLYLLDF